MIQSMPFIYTFNMFYKILYNVWNTYIYRKL